MRWARLPFMELNNVLSLSSFFSEKRITADIIRKAQVICCTCIGAGDPILDDQYFPLVVLDESTQAVEPATLVSSSFCFILPSL